MNFLMRTGRPFKSSGKFMQTLDDLLIHELHDLHHAEEQIIEALPKMEQAASSPELKHAFKEHLEVSKKQKQRLHKIIGMMNVGHASGSCEGIMGIVTKRGEPHQGEGRSQGDQPWGIS